MQHVLNIVLFDKGVQIEKAARRMQIEAVAKVPIVRRVLVAIIVELVAEGSDTDTLDMLGEFMEIRYEFWVDNDVDGCMP
jgi:hypothetical protein